MKIGISACAIIENAEGKFLFVRLKKGPFEGGICIPGGRIEPGELSHEAIKREIKEETGIDINSEARPFGFCETMQDESQNHRVCTLLYGRADGEPKNTEETDSFWMTFEEAEKSGGMVKMTKEAFDIWKNNKVHFVVKE